MIDRPCLTILAPTFTSWSRKVVIDQWLTASGKVRVQGYKPLDPQPLIFSRRNENLSIDAPERRDLTSVSGRKDSNNI